MLIIGSSKNFSPKIKKQKQFDKTVENDVFKKNHFIKYSVRGILSNNDFIKMNFS